MTKYEDDLVVTPAEDAILALVEQARPVTTAEGAWTAWFRVYQPHLDGALREVSATLDETETAALARIQASAPLAGGENDALVWLDAADDVYNDAYPGYGAPKSQYVTRFDALALVRPNAGGPKAYKGWLAVYTNHLANVVGDQTISEDEQQEIDRWMAVKPCGVDDAGQAAYDRVVARRANVAQVSAPLALTIDAAAPTACEVAPPPADPAQEE